MSLILESDIIYNILPCINLSTIGKLFCVNKCVNKLCHDKYFWKEKLKHDWKNVIPKSDEWTNEYKCIYKIYIRSIKFIDNFIAGGTEHLNNYNSSSFKTHVNELINLDYFRWITGITPLPTGSKAQTSIIYMNTNIKKFCVTFITRTNIFTKVSSASLSHNEFTDYVINLYYNHDCIHMSEYKNKKIIPF